MIILFMSAAQLYPEEEAVSRQVYLAQRACYHGKFYSFSPISKADSGEAEPPKTRAHLTVRHLL
jgi:hypothetical protein